MNTDKFYAEQIANEYSPKDTSKVVKLKKLDSKAKMPATIFTYSFGIISALVLGVGMCLTMGEIGNGTTVSMVFGIIIGVIGMIGMGTGVKIDQPLVLDTDFKSIASMTAVAFWLFIGAEYAIPVSKEVKNAKRKQPNQTTRLLCKRAWRDSNPRSLGS